MNGKRVVISAGSSGTRKKISSVLSTAGYLVIGETDNGPGALRLIQTLQPDVAVIDIDSAQGLSAAKLLDDDGQIGLVLVGTHPRQEHKNQVSSGQILKPVNETALLTATDFAAAGQKKLRKMADELTKLKDMLETRKLVERAKGILMESLALSETEAYKRIQQQSMNKRLPLKRIAESIITAFEFK
jgi:response regulator NasT